MRFHHTGCLVKSIEEGLESFLPLASGPAQKPIFVAKQQVTVCLVPLGPDTFVELVCPGPKARGLLSMLEASTSLYHLAFKTDALEETVDGLLTMGFQMVASFHSEAFEGALCTFVKSPSGELIEFIEENEDG